MASTMIEESFTFQAPLIEQALLEARGAAAIVDVKSDTKLLEAVKDSQTKYRDLYLKNHAAAVDVRTEINNFLTLDFAILKNTAVPFAHRYRTVKAVATKIMAAVEKSENIRKEADTVKESLTTMKPDGDSFTEAEPEAAGTLAKTSINVEEKLDDLQRAWKKVDVDTAAFDTYLINDIGDGADEDSFIPGLMLAIQSMKTVVSFLSKI